MPQLKKINLHIDIVIDANVFKHTSYVNDFTVNCENLLEKVCESNVKLCFDEEFNSRNYTKSMIGYEYLKHNKVGSTGYNYLMRIIKKQNIIVIEKKKLNNSKKIFVKYFQSNKQIDKIFTSVAYCSTDKLFITNDYEDFKNKKRDFFFSKYKLFVYCVNSCECV
jgi:hypothetical protein